MTPNVPQAARTASRAQTGAAVTRIFYTGDVCNSSGWFTTPDALLGHQPVTLTEEPSEWSGGRVIPVLAHHVGHTYKGHCNPRFVTEAAYRAFHAQQRATLERR